jgi:hypothetical protein
MDRTLRSYLQQADDAHAYLDKCYVALTTEQMETKVIELQSAIKTLQSVAYQMANVSNIINRAVMIKKRNKSNALTDYINPYPTETDIGTLRSLNPVESKEIVADISIPVKTVESITDIPVSDVYYVNDVQQFAVNIAGIVIRGNLGNIVDYKSENSAKCEYGIQCKSFINKTQCPYYHDPLDYKHHKILKPNNIRNFTVGSWIYSKKKTPSSYFTRHIGSADKLIYDLNTLKKIQYRDEIFNREGQLIHDLLIYLVLNSRGLLDRYPHWKYMPKNS